MLLDTIIRFRCNQEHKKAFEKAALAANMTLSAWIMQALKRALS
jgi:predicted HicB family RNase H-like nuclease